jgi:ABC-type phosphate transport system ATPase subunit
MNDRLIVRGAREHNLKDVSLDMPRNSLIVFTGLSGSGLYLQKGNADTLNHFQLTPDNFWGRWISQM